MTAQEKRKIVIDGLEFAYPGRSRRDPGLLALRDINLAIEENEIFAFIGPSGCGKTTLLFLIAGLIKPTRGEIRVDGRPVQGPGPDRVVVFQEDAVFPWLTVEKNVEYGLKLQGVPLQERRKLVNRYIHLVGLEGFEKAYPRQLSGGMKKRVDIARCYAVNPGILLMDEPFGSLDVFTKQKMQEELRQIWKAERKTICFVTHDIEEAIFVAHRLGIFTRRPGTVKRIVRVPFGEERKLDLRTRSDFQALRLQVQNEIFVEDRYGEMARL